jgi:DNA-binding GntR family transcriptional regulator
VLDSAHPWESEPTADTVEHVHQVLRNMILDGSLLPGAVVSQVYLANELGVSRTPLREALRLLQHEGLIEVNQRRRPRIAPVEPSAIDALYADRILTEALGITLTVPQLRPADIDALKKTLAAMSNFLRRKEFDAWQVSHKQFHHQLVSHAGRHLVAKIAAGRQRSQRYIRLYAQVPQMWEVGQPEHVSIAEVWVQGNASLAAERLARHLARSALNILSISAPEYEPRALRCALSLIGATGEQDRLRARQDAKKMAGHGRRRQGQPPGPPTRSACS